MTRMFPSYSTALLGLQGGASLLLSSFLELGLDAEALVGQSELSDASGTLGSMQLYWFTGGLGLFARSASRPEIDFGPRIRVGYGLADAHTDRAGGKARDDHGLVLSLLAAAYARSQISEGVSLLLGVDMSYTAVGIVFLGDQARLSGMAGITWALRIGAAW